MITKEVRLGKIQILDEREPWAAQHGQMIARCALLLMENGVQVEQLEDYPMKLSPDIDVSAACDEVSQILAPHGFGPVPADVRMRCQVLCQADHTPQMKACWKVCQDTEIVRRLLARDPPGLRDNFRAVAEQQLRSSKDALAALEGPPDLSLHRETRFNLAEVLPDGQVQVRLRKCICENGKVISPPTYHRFVLHPGGLHAATLAGINIARAQQEGAPAMTQGDMERILRICATDHTPGRITAWQAAEAARRQP